MSEPKPMASLNSGLLARKGDARPAMRRAFSTGPAPLLPLSVQQEVDDLGWNDMGEEAFIPPADAVVPEVRQQQSRIEKTLTSMPKRQAISPDVVARIEPRKAKAAFTLRLDPDRHLRLRLACAVGNRSAQQIVTQALDAFLDSQPDIAALAKQVPQPGAANV
jgi:hypothetical protein